VTLAELASSQGFFGHILRFPDIPDISTSFRGFHKQYSEKVSRKMDISFEIVKFPRFSEVFRGF
jgi:hypothetical protein